MSLLAYLHLSIVVHFALSRFAPAWTALASFATPSASVSLAQPGS
jgi:hypothetical protein